MINKCKLIKPVFLLQTMIPVFQRKGDGSLVLSDSVEALAVWREQRGKNVCSSKGSYCGKAWCSGDRELSIVEEMLETRSMSLGQFKIQFGQYRLVTSNLYNLVNCCCCGCVFVWILDIILQLSILNRLPSWQSLLVWLVLIPDCTYILHHINTTVMKIWPILMFLRYLIWYASFVS